MRERARNMRIQPQIKASELLEMAAERAIDERIKFTDAISNKCVRRRASMPRATEA